MTGATAPGCSHLDGLKQTLPLLLLLHDTNVATERGGDVSTPQVETRAAGDGAANEGGSGGISSSGGIVRLLSRNSQRATIKESETQQVSV